MQGPKSTTTTNTMTSSNQHMSNNNSQGVRTSAFANNGPQNQPQIMMGGLNGSNHMNPSASNNTNVGESDLGLIAAQLQSQHSKMEGLENLAAELQKMPARKVLVGQAAVGGGSYLQQIFRGLRSCLQVSDSQTDTLLKANQVLYEIMQDLQRSPDQIMPEVTTLIPTFIENLGNSKASVRKSTHKCIGTFVKFTKQLEFVLLNIIKYGLENTNQRTRQHSMLVIPALISLKAAVINDQNSDMRKLVDTVVSRLRDQAEPVSKTAKKLILELNKCYPQTFKVNYVDTINSEEDRTICDLILENRLDEATKMIMNSSPSQRMAANAGKASQQIPSAASQGGPGASRGANFADQVKQQQQFGAVGKGLGPTNSLQQNDQQAAYSTSAAMQSQQNPANQGALLGKQATNSAGVGAISQGGGALGHHGGDLSVIGREIMGSAQGSTSAATNSTNQHQTNSSNVGLGVGVGVGQGSTNNATSNQEKQGRGGIQSSSTSGQQTNKARGQQSGQIQEVVAKVTKSGHPIDPSNGLVFGFLPENAVEGLNENNQWKDRTVAMEKIEKLFTQQITPPNKAQFAEENATAFLAYVYKFIPDINFKISFAAIKIVTNLLREQLVTLKKHFTAILQHLIEKLSDSKQVVRDLVLECSSCLIQYSKPHQMVAMILKNLQHANWHVREGVLILIARCILIQNSQQATNAGGVVIKSPTKPKMPKNQQQNNDTSVVWLTTNQPLVEELCFLVKVEDKRALQLMGIDILALMLSTSVMLGVTEGIITKELGFQGNPDSLQGLASTKDNHIYSQIQQRVKERALPFINGEDLVEFAAASASAPTLNQPSAMFLKNKEPNNKSNTTSAAATVTPTPPYDSSKTPSMAFMENKIKEENIFRSGPINPLSGKVTKQQATSALNAAAQPQSPSANAQFSQQNNTNQTIRQLPTKNAQNQAQNSKAQASGGESKEKIAMWLPSFTKNGQQIQDGDQQHNTQQLMHQKSEDVNLMRSPQRQIRVDSYKQQNSLNTGGVGSSSDAINQQISSPTASIQMSTKSMPPMAVNSLRGGASSQQQQNALGKGQNNNLQQSPLGAGGRRNNELTESNFKNNGFRQDQKKQTTSSYGAEVGGASSALTSAKKKDNTSGFSTNTTNVSTNQQMMNKQGGDQLSSNASGYDRSQISDRLQLLKSSNKYKQSDNDSSSAIKLDPVVVNPLMSQSHQPSSAKQEQMKTQTMSYHQQQQHQQSLDDQSDAQSAAAHSSATVPNNSLYANTNSQKRNGPIRAAHLRVPEDQKSAGGNDEKRGAGYNPVHHQAVRQRGNSGVPTHIQLKQRAQLQAQQMGGGGMKGGISSNANQQNNQVQVGTVTSYSANKPPTMSQFSNFSGYDEISQASSIDHLSSVQGGPISDAHSFHNSKNRHHHIQPISQSEKKGHRLEVPQTQGSLSNLMKQDSSSAYETKEDPLVNPENQLRQAVDSLKSSDWAKTFEGCNIIKRAVLFHKQLFSHPSPVAGQIFKDIVKPVDSLRSQVSKNACMTLSLMFSELPPRDVDSHIDTVMPTLIKRATDTNAFIAQEAEKVLIAICNNCTESRCFSSLQSQALKSAAYKEKVCFCYTALIERLAHRLKSFRDLERLVQSIVRFLSEGSIEVRNQAKYAVLTLQSACGSQRELDGILLKARLNENQLEKVKKVLASEDFESLSNYANTRYGASMRASPLGGARHTQYGAVGANNKLQRSSAGYGASGSDGFTRQQVSNMQQTFLSSGATPGQNLPRGGSSGPAGSTGIGNMPRRGKGGQMNLIDNNLNIPRGAASNQGSSSGFDGTQNTFNKRTTSVSKPVDRMLLEEFKDLVASANTNDWHKRCKAIDTMQEFAETHRQTIRTAQTSTFINLVDFYCKMVQDPNTKVQTKAQNSMDHLLQVGELGPLFHANLLLLSTAFTGNLCSTNAQVRNNGEKLFDSLEEVAMTESRGNVNNLIQPLVSQLNNNQNRAAKPTLVERLSNLIERVDKQSLITRLLNPLVQPGHKLQQESNGNVHLREALQKLALCLQSADMGIGLKQF